MLAALVVAEGYVIVQLLNRILAKTGVQPLDLARPARTERVEPTPEPRRYKVQVTD